MNQVSSVLSKNQDLNEPLSLQNIQNKSVLLDFNGGLLSSDAGILLLREVEEQIGLIRAMSEVIPDSRDLRYVKHSLYELLIQRIGQIACGYEDANDCNELRHDPIFKMLAGRYPELDEALASQPTMSRFENSISRPNLYRLARVFADTFIAAYDAAPKIIVLDFDDTNSDVYGTQQLSLFNAYYGEYCFMPLHVYEGLSGKLVTTILKPGHRCNGDQMLAIIKRLINHLRAQWPETIIVFRGDSHFTYSQVMNWIDTQKNVMYVTGLTGNSRLKKEVDGHIESAKRAYEKYDRKIVRFHSFYYQAESWSKSRRVVAKIEVSEKGVNVRFVVTDMENARAKVLYQTIYCARGEDELYLKDHKLYLKSDRSSCRKFQANQFRLFLHSAAYVLIHTLKLNVLKGTPFANATFNTIQLRLLKIAARVKELKTRVKVELPTSCPLKETIRRSFQILETVRSAVP